MTRNPLVLILAAWLAVASLMLLWTNLGDTALCEDALSTRRQIVTGSSVYPHQYKVFLPNAELGVDRYCK